MVRRLVEQEQIRIFGDGTRKKHTAFLATAQAVVRSIRINASFAQNSFGSRIVDSIVQNFLRNHGTATHHGDTPHHDIANRPVEVRRNFLNHAAHTESRLFHDFAGIRLHLARQHFQKRTFAFAITAHKANAVARLDIERDIIQKRRTAKTQQYILN